MEPRERLTTWMAAHHMTKEDLAAAVGLSSNMIWRITSGNREVSDNFRWRFGKTFGFDTALRLLEDEEEE